MAKQYSQKTRFQSKYTDKEVFITDHQYLAELMCEKIAYRDKLTLTYKFWNLPRWRHVFILQCKHAASLLEDFRVFDIIEALKDARCRKVYSLGARYILDNVITDVVKRKKAAKPVVRKEVVSEEEVIRPIFQKKNPMGEL